MGRAKASMPAMGTLRCSRLLLNNNKGGASFLSVSVNSFFFQKCKVVFGSPGAGELTELLYRAFYVSSVFLFFSLQHRPFSCRQRQSHATVGTHHRGLFSVWSRYLHIQRGWQQNHIGVVQGFYSIRWQPDAVVHRAMEQEGWPFCMYTFSNACFSFFSFSVRLFQNCLPASVRIAWRYPAHLIFGLDAHFGFSLALSLAFSFGSLV